MEVEVLTAKVATVSIGQLKFEGLLIQDGRYAVSSQQINNLFSISAHPNHVTRSLKHLLGDDYAPTRLKVKNGTIENKNRKFSNSTITSSVFLDDFRRVIRKLDKQGNFLAQDIVEMLLGVSLEQLFADAFDVPLTKSDRQQIASRILDVAAPWERLYDENRNKGFKWFGYRFYNDYIYCFFTPEEWCKINNLNPVRKEKNGRCDRLQRIHQYIESSTKDRLRDTVATVLGFVDVSNTPEEFQELYRRKYGRIEQLSLSLTPKYH